MTTLFCPAGAVPVLPAAGVVGIGAVVTAARELLDKGTYGYWDVAAPGAAAARSAFTT